MLSSYLFLIFHNIFLCFSFPIFFFKILKHICFSQLQAFINHYNLLLKCQSSFIVYTTTKLHFWSCAQGLLLRSPRVNRCLDFFKAFNIVKHDLPLISSSFLAYLFFLFLFFLFFILSNCFLWRSSKFGPLLFNISFPICHLFYFL